MGAESTIPARSWIERLARETGAFRLGSLSAEQPGGSDDIAEIEVAATRARLILVIEVRSRLSPRVALGAVAQLRAHGTQRPGCVPLICAPYVSPRCAEICREAGVGYLDEAGNCLLAGPGLFVSVTGRPNPRPDTRKAVNPFATRSSRVARLLLTEPDRSWLVKELAEESGASIGLVSRVKTALIEEALVEHRDGRLRVADPQALLRAWVEAYEPPAATVAAYRMAALDRLEPDLDAACTAAGLDHAFTGFAAAWRYAPTVRYQQPAVYVERSAEAGTDSQLLERLGLKSVESGANLVVLLTDDAGPLIGAGVVGGLRVVSPLQAYLDLARRPGRGEEAAAALYEKLLRPGFARARSAREEG